MNSKRSLAGLRGGELAGAMWMRVWVIAGLTGLAVTQPLLELFGRNPEFFVAGNYSRVQITLFALLIMLLPPVVAIVLTAVASFLDRRAGTVVFVIVTTVFATALALAVMRTLRVDSTVLVVPLAIVSGFVAAALIVRVRGVQLLVAYLAVANLLFVGSFLLMSRSAELVLGHSGADVGRVDVPTVQGPIILVVLDELPAASIMRGDGSINAERYPGFASLASVSTWFRNASSHDSHSNRAVPAVLTGVIPGEDDLPTYNDHPRNLFTLMGGNLPVQRYEPLTDMCPSSICEPPPRESLTQALEDACVVYGHRVLPSSLRDDLPAIDSSWGSYASAADAAVPSMPDEDEGGAGSSAFADQAFSRWKSRAANEKSPRGQAAVFAERIAAIDGMAGVHFIHVGLPHRPFVLSPSGLVTSYTPKNLANPSSPGYHFRARLRFQLHSMQLGATDRLVGALVDHLRELPSWNNTLLVVTSDHGDNHTPPNIGRAIATDDNKDEVFRVPLFIKAPGQVAGDIRDDSAQTIDVLPSIADLTGIETDWEFDGHSLLDGSEAHTAPNVSTDVEEVLAIAAQRSEEFSGDDWTGLAAVGTNGDLVGERVEDFEIGEPSGYRASLEQEALLAHLPAEDGAMPFVLAGRVSRPGGSEEEPPELLVAVNGTLAGVVGGYQPADRGWGFVGYVADFYREGANDVELYEVDRESAHLSLRPVRRSP